MKIELFIKKVLLYCGLDVRLVKKNQILSLEEIKEVNDNTLNYIQSLSENELNRRVKSICCKDPLDQINTVDISNTLNKEGIVVIPEFLSEDEINKTRHTISDVLLNVKINDAKREDHENDDYIVQRKIIKGQSYFDLSNNPKPVVVIRQGNDQGMIDIFNVDRLLGKLGAEIHKVFIKNWLVKLFQDYKEPVNPKNLNLYINHSITKTRGFHVDSNYRSIKAFIYLTDVNTLEDGPYCYVKGTHVDTPFRKVNKLLGEKEAPFTDHLDITPIIGKKGTLILADQSGIHRGIPQKQGSIREVLVMRYR